MRNAIVDVDLYIPKQRTSCMPMRFAPKMLLATVSAIIAAVVIWEVWRGAQLAAALDNQLDLFTPDDRCASCRTLFSGVCADVVSPRDFFRRHAAMVPRETRIVASATGVCGRENAG